MAGARAWRLEHIDALRDVASVMYRDENMIIRHKMRTRTVDLGAPILSAIIAQGEAEGLFRTSDPDELARLILHLSNAAGETNMRAYLAAGGDPGALTAMVRRINFLIETLERMLGAAPGCLSRVGEGFSRALRRAAAREGGGE
jgi:hypothetical protein